MNRPRQVAASRTLNGAKQGLFCSALLFLLMPCALLWSYWPTIVSLVRDWLTDDNYSVGALVPFAAVYLLWHRRAALAKWRPSPCWWGAGLLLVAQAARAFGLLFYFKSIERYSLVLTVVGAVLLIGGRRITREVRWILLFLFLMVPLPGRVHLLISEPLQSFATAGAVFALELFGVTVMRQGNVMVLNDNVSVAVTEACSGLRMLTAFVVVAATLAFVVRRRRWQKVTIVLSSIPVSIVCNLARLVVTAVLFVMASDETAERFFHDFAGLTMMPLAVVMLLGELWIMDRLVIDDHE